MRTIALISEHASPLSRPGSVDSGGQNIYVAHVARQLAARGWHVDVFTRRDRRGQPTVLQWEPRIRVIHVPAGPARHVPKEKMLPYMPAFAHFLEDFCVRQPFHYDVVHANFFMSGMAGHHLAKRLRIPFVITFHALGKVRQLHQKEADQFPTMRLKIEEELVQAANGIIAECPQDYNDLVQLYNADPHRIAVVPCGFDAREFSPMDKIQARRSLGWDEHAFYVLQLGRIVPRKGIDNVIRALALLRCNHHIEARLCVVGSNQPEGIDNDPELNRLRAVASHCDMTAYVEFAGLKERHELGSFYNAADTFVTTPWYEPFGITPVEAMACARPVVGANVGGIPYTVKEGETGYLVPPCDPAALATRLAMLARNPELAWRMGNAGLRRARQLFTWARVASQLEGVYLSAMERATDQRTIHPADTISSTGLMAAGGQEVS